MRLFVFLVIIFFCFSCSVNTSEKVDLDALSFHYNDDAYVFFRNMRQTYYDLEVMEEGGWRIYRHEDRQKDTSTFYFNVALVVDWRANRIYPIVEMPENLKNKAYKIEWVSTVGGDMGSFQLAGRKRADERLLLAEIYNKAMEEVVFFYVNKDTRKPILNNSDHKEAFRVTMYDYFRMTGLL